MKLNAIDWKTITRAQALRLLGPANRAEHLAAARFEISGSPEDEAAMLAAFEVWENLQVFVYAGVRPQK